MLRKKKEKVNSQTIIVLIEQCNQNCLFCSGSEREKMDNREIRREILMTKGAVIFEGGEPTISKNLLNWIKVAKNSGVKEIVLVTNGVLLSSMDFAKKLINSGITLFNISFHSHRKSLYNLITQSDCYSLAIRGLKNLVWLGAAPKTRLTFVIAKVNYRTMPGYVEWVRKNFPGIFYIAFNYIKVLGKVKNNPTYYVPKFKEARPYLFGALKVAKENKMKVLTDGFPLCLMDEFIECNEDVQVFKETRDFSFFEEKTKTKKCKNCSLGSICGGIRKDYLKLYGDKELKPSFKNLNDVMLKLSKS